MRIRMEECRANVHVACIPTKLDDCVLSSDGGDDLAAYQVYPKRGLHLKMIQAAAFRSAYGFEAPSTAGSATMWARTSLTPSSAPPVTIHRRLPRGLGARAYIAC